MPTMSIPNDVTVIIPVYNRATLCWTAINSVMQQTTQPHALIIVDDGSTDDTARKIEQWIAQESHDFPITLLKEQHKGASAARNAGLQEMARELEMEIESERVRERRMGRSLGKAMETEPEGCEFIMFLDSDDQLPADFIARSTLLLQENPTAAAVSCPRLTLYNNKVVFDDLADFARSPVEWMLYYGGSILSCTVFRKDRLPGNGFVEDLKVGEDMILAAEVYSLGKWLVAEGEPVKFYRNHGETNESPCITADHNLSSVLQGIKARRIIMNSPPYDEEIAASYKHSILSDWWKLAARRSAAGLAESAKSKSPPNIIAAFCIRNFGRYALISYYYFVRKWLSRLAGN